MQTQDAHEPRLAMACAAASVIVGAGLAACAIAPEGGEWLPLEDKAQHVLGFALLAALLSKAGLSPAVLIPALAVLSIGLEFAQYAFFPWRESSAFDALASALGAVIGLSAGCLRGWALFGLGLCACIAAAVLLSRFEPSLAPLMDELWAAARPR